MVAYLVVVEDDPPPLVQHVADVMADLRRRAHVRDERDQLVLCVINIALLGNLENMVTRTFWTK